MAMFPGDDITRLLPTHLKSLADDLKKYPSGYAKWLYGSVSNNIYQGDIIQNLTVVAVDEDGDPVSRAGAVVVMSHTCDAQPAQCDYVLVAPIFSFRELRETGEMAPQRLEDHLRDLRANRLTGRMFLPEVGNLPDSFIDFSQVSTIANEHFQSPEVDVRRQRIASLSQKGHYFFLMKLAFHFCRADPVDSTRATESSPASDQPPPTRSAWLRLLWKHFRASVKPPSQVE
ncbi:MAG: hypothetical protein ACYDCM_07140 [Candidatus Acidiferrales bacterium]